MLGGVAAGWLRVCGLLWTLMLPWLPFHHSLGSAPKALYQAAVGHGQFLLVWSVWSAGRSVLCQLLGTDTHHCPGGAASTQLSAQTQAAPRAAPAFCCCPAGSCGTSWLPTAPTFVSFPSPPSHPSQHPIPGGNLRTREGIRMQLEEQLKCWKKLSSAAEGGRGVLPCAKATGRGTFVQEAPCASPGHLSRARSRSLAPQASPGPWGLW